MKEKIKKFGLIFWVHLILILLAWLSPFWLNWKIIIVFILLYYFQLLVFKNCVLTKKQFKTKSRSITFYSFILQEAGFNVNPQKIRWLADNVFPFIILSIAIIWQVLLDFNILL